MIDLAVPRDVEPAVGELPGVELHDIDALESVVSRNRAARAGEAVQGEEIVAAEAERFRRWLASLDVVPAITGLRDRAEAIRGRELLRYEGRWESLEPARPRARRAADALDRAQAAARADRPPAGRRGRPRGARPRRRGARALRSARQ